MSEQASCALCQVSFFIFSTWALHNPQRMSQNGGKDLNHKKTPQPTRILRSAFAFIGVRMKNILNMEHFLGKGVSVPAQNDI